MSDEAKKATTETIELARPYAMFAGIGLLFAGAAVFFEQKAANNDRGLIINGIIHLEPGGADVFYAVLAALSGSFVVLAFLAVYGLRRRKVFRIVLAKKWFSMSPPVRAWQGKVAEEEVKIRYEDLVAVSLSPVGSPTQLKVTRRDGPPLHLSKQFIRAGWTIQGIADRIMNHARADADASAAKAAKKAASTRNDDATDAKP